MNRKQSIKQEILERYFSIEDQYGFTDATGTTQIVGKPIETVMAYGVYIELGRIIEERNWEMQDTAFPSL